MSDQLQAPWAFAFLSQSQLRYDAAPGFDLRFEDRKSQDRGRLKTPKMDEQFSCY